MNHLPDSTVFSLPYYRWTKFTAISQGY